MPPICLMCDVFKTDNMNGSECALLLFQTDYSSEEGMNWNAND